MDDAEELSQQTARWKELDYTAATPKTLTIDVYLDLQELTRGKSCVITDDQGKRWDVSDTASSSNIPEFDMDEQPLVLERWRFSLEVNSTASADPDSDSLSSLYKKAVPVFRSISSHARLLPAWKYYRQQIKHNSSNPPNPQLKLKYRVHSGGLSTQTKEALELPLYPNQRNVTDGFVFGSLHSPAGTLHASVSFRTNCNFRVDDSESLLSSQFMRSGDDYFRPSWSGKGNDHQVVGSAPATKQRHSTDDSEQTQVYGSMSTFHTSGARTSTSPISALRALTSAGSPLSPSGKLSASQRRAQESRASLQSNDGAPLHQRRQSISFNPFKAGSLASSPATTGMQGPLSPVSQSSRAGTSYSHRSRPSMTTHPQAILRQPSLYQEHAVASSASSSPRPAPIQKFSSSFNYRKSRMSSGASKNDDEHGSTGKASPSSSARAGSDVLTEARGGQASSGSVQQDDDENLKDFLQLLDTKKELKSLSRTDSAARDASTRKTNTALSKYQRMKDSNIALSDSISSSIHLDQSSSAPGRALSRLPAIAPGTSTSPGSSLGKQLSPHAPYTPTVPSRLSANSIVDYSMPPPRRSRRSFNHEPRPESIVQQNEEHDADDTDTSHAINIPASPMPWSYGRRSSSVRQQRIVDEEHITRPYSLPADDRDLSMTDLSIADSRQASEQTSSEEKIGSESVDDPFPGYAGPAPFRNRHSPTADPKHANFTRHPRGSLSRRGTPSFGQSYTTSSASQSGIVAPGSKPERGGARGGPTLRGSTQEEENLIFELSDMDSRRSLEESRNDRGNPNFRRGFRGGR